MYSHGLKERYELILSLRNKGMASEAIGKQIGLSRAAVQRMVWLSQLPAYVRIAYLKGRFPDGKIFGFWQLRGDPKALRAAFKTREAYRRRKVSRTEAEVRRALSLADNPLVIRTLLWFVGETSTLPA